MVAVDNATAAQLLRQPVSDQEATMRGIVHSLSRSLAEDLAGDDVASDDLMAQLDIVLAGPPRPRPASPILPRREDFLTRCGFPRFRPQRTSPAVSLTDDEARQAVARFRTATTQLIQAAPHRVGWYPTEELRRLKALRDEDTAEDQILAYLRRYALALLAVLDLMGNDTCPTPSLQEPRQPAAAGSSTGGGLRVVPFIAPWSNKKVIPGQVVAHRPTTP